MNHSGLRETVSRRIGKKPPAVLVGQKSFSYARKKYPPLI
jgi:hypothetical protein